MRQIPKRMLPCLCLGYNPRRCPWAHVKFLADDSSEGRNTGSEGLRKAQAYAVEQLQKAGFEPAGTDGFYQSIRFTQFQVDESKSSLALVANGQSQLVSFSVDRDFLEIS